MGADPAPRGKGRLARVRGHGRGHDDGSGVAMPGSQAGDLDRLIHERVRLGIVSALAAAPSMTFVELKDALALTDGNLSVHARRLEEAGYVSCAKGFEGRVPKTEYALTAKGRAALARYLDHMEALIRAARGGASAATRPERTGRGA
jgi:DNA-binding MarR family transcriptional regulator